MSSGIGVVLGGVGDGEEGSRKKRKKNAILEFNSPPSIPSIYSSTYLQPQLPFSQFLTPPHISLPNTNPPPGRGDGPYHLISHHIYYPTCQFYLCYLMDGWME